MKNSVTLIVILVVAVSQLHAQTTPLNSFLNSGGAIVSETGSVNPSHIGVVGQPITGFFSGTLVISNLMYATDLHPPVITYNPDALAVRLNEENSMTYQATDNDQVVSSKIFYKPIGTTGAFNEVTVTPSSGSSYVKAIASNWYDLMGMEYYIEARDKENTTRHPAGAGKHVTWVTNPAPQIPTTLLSYGRTKNNYRIISVPYETTSPITQIFEELGPSNKKKYRIYKYDAAAFAEYPSFTTVKRGEGYFIIMSDALSDVVLSMPELKAPANSQDNPYEFSLKPGWNLIGNPYTVGISWDDILNFNGQPENLASDLKSWTGTGQYENIKDLQAYQGAFVWLEGTQPLPLKISFKGQLPEEIDGGRKGSKYESWKVNFVLSDGKEENKMAAFGMHTEASESFDKLDDIDPPSLEEFLTVKFAHPEHSQKYFLRDIVPYAPAHVWDVEIPSTNDSERTLDWSAADLSKIPADLQLYDEGGNFVVDMKKSVRYTFSSSATKFKIFYGPADQYEIHPQQITVIPPYPNPVMKDQEMIFSVGLPESQHNYFVVLEIFDAIGNRIHQQEEFLSPGLREVRVRKKTEIAGASGELLFYQLNVGERSFSGKIIFKH